MRSKAAYPKLSANAPNASLHKLETISHDGTCVIASAPRRKLVPTTSGSASLKCVSCKRPI